MWSFKIEDIKEKPFARRDQSCNSTSRAITDADVYCVASHVESKTTKQIHLVYNQYAFTIECFGVKREWITIRHGLANAKT